MKKYLITEKVTGNILVGFDSLDKANSECLEYNQANEQLKNHKHINNALEYHCQYGYEVIENNL